MPRNVSGIYTVPVGTDGVANTTIFSAKYNTYIHDVESDLNTPRPIVAGGTGASDATSALVALGGEKALQQVTNYDTFAFVPGSFWSAVGATSAPTSTARFVGYCVVDGDGTGDTTIVAWPPGTSSNAQYQRKKTGGAWTAWIQVASALSDTDLLYVKKGGDAMTGNLSITPTAGSAYVNLAAPAALTGQAMINMIDNGVNKWQVGKQTDNSFLIYDTAASLGKLAIGSGTGPGTGISLNGGAGAINLSSTGGITLSGGGTGNIINGPTQFGQPLAVTAAGVNVQFGGSSPIGFYTDAANVAIRPPSASGLIYMQSNGGANTYGRFTPTGMSVDVGNFACVGDVSCGSSSANAGVFRFGNNGQSYIYSDGGNYNFGGGFGIVLSGTINTSVASWALVQNGIQGTSSYMMVANPGGFQLAWYGAYVAGQYGRIYAQLQGVAFYFENGGTAAKPGGGVWADSSDARIKDVVGEYKAGLAEIGKLNPVIFIYKGNDTFEEPKESSDIKAKAYTGEAPYPNSTHIEMARTKKRVIGLVAQQCEDIMPELVKKQHGFLDGKEIDDMRVLDGSALTYALINAVKELKARVEALEGA